MQYNLCIAFKAERLKWTNLLRFESSEGQAIAMLNVNVVPVSSQNGYFTLLSYFLKRLKIKFLKICFNKHLEEYDTSFDIKPKKFLKV